MLASATIYGKTRAIRFLSNAKQRGALANSYLFSGPDGVGKQFLARLFAQTVNCEDGAVFSFCACTSCRKIAEGLHPDIQWIGLDEEERSIKIEEVRALQSWLYFKPLEGRMKVFIINGAERLTEEAGNAFLKVLEEPPRDTHMILLSAYPGRLLGTIRSRLVDVAVAPLPYDELARILADDFACSSDAPYLARLAEGSLGRALDYCANDFVAFKNTIIKEFVTRGPARYFLSHGKLTREVCDLILGVLLTFMNDALLLRCGLGQKQLNHSDCSEYLKHFVRSFSREQTIRLLTACDEVRQDIKRNSSIKLALLYLAAQSEHNISTGKAVTAS